MSTPSGVAEGPGMVSPGAGNAPTHAGSEFEDAVLQGLIHGGSASPVPLPGDRLGGLDGRRYEVLGLLGGGGMGQVFRAVDHELWRTVALKFLAAHRGLATPSLLAALREEAQAIARLDHENIVRIHDVSAWNTGTLAQGEEVPLRVPFLVMEFLEGESLQRMLRRERPDLRRTLDLMTDVAAGLAHAHERRLVHRDLKPANVFVLADGRAKLLDFGLARSPAGPALAPEAARAGTPAYMAPEQWRGEPPDARADVWAAGLLLYELLTGEHPLPRSKAAELRLHIPSSQPMPSVSWRCPGLPEELVRLVASALAKDPAERPANGGELLERLRGLRRLLALDVNSASRSSISGRRLVTLVSCRLAQERGGMERLDPEDCSELEGAFHQGCTRIIHEHEGAMTLAVGAEVLACFGFPVAREGDSERAVRAALRLQEVLPGELAGLGPPGVVVKVGLHTDRVALADASPLLHGTAPPMQGEAPKVASWLAAQAGPDAVLLTEGTHALVRGRIRTRSLGAWAFEGLSGTSWLDVHEALGERPGASRFDRALVVGALSPLVGRERELQRLTTWRADALSGRGVGVLVRGDAGIGKSRLVQELHDREAPGTSTWARCQCGVRGTGSAFHPLIDWFQRFLGFARDDAPERKLARLVERLGVLGVDVELSCPLASFLSLPVPEGSPFLHLSGERQRAAMMKALVEVFRHEDVRRPVVLVVEDLHWADPSTLQFLGVLLERLEGTRLCVLLTARPGVTQVWSEHAALHFLDVEPLPPEATAALVREVAGQRALTPKTVARLVSRTDGVPLFVEELTRVVVEQEAVRGDSGETLSAVPAVLHELLLARLDQLPPRQRSQVQLAATLGREFNYETLRAVSFLREDELEPELERLEEAGLLFRQGQPPCTTYAFRHALIQEAAYQSLLRSTRQRYHGRVVQVLSEQFPEVVEEQPELVAHHATLAGLTRQAAEFWRSAGQLAGAKSAFPEAISHYSRALGQLELLPPSRERDEFDIVLRVELGQALVASKGFGTREVEDAFTRAAALCDPSQCIPTSLFWGLWNIALVRGDGEGMDRLAELFRCQGDEHADLEARVVLHGALNSQAFWRADYTSCRSHGLEVKALLGREGVAEQLAQIRGGRLGHASEQCLHALMYLAVSELVLGHTDTALATQAQAFALAESMSHPYAIATVSVFGAMLALERGDPATMLEVSGRAVGLCVEYGFPLPLVGSICLHGLSLAVLGDAEGGVARVHEGIALMNSLGATLLQGACLTTLARAYLAGGKVDEGLAALSQARVHVEGRVARHPLATLLRVHGQLLLLRGDMGEARECFRRSLAVARDTGARLHELGAAVELARLARHTDEAAEARVLLESLKEVFSGSQALADAWAARALLAEWD